MNLGMSFEDAMNVTFPQYKMLMEYRRE